jgi:antitoxin ParD1/3/4
MPTMNISLTPELVKLVKAKVKSGMYNNASEFMREAVRQYETTRDYLYQIKLAQLKADIAEGVAQIERGEYSSFSLEELQRDIKKARKRK